MKLNGKLLRLIFYLVTLGSLFFYLLANDLLKWIIAGASIIYLIFYFGIATIAIFSVSFNELGSLMNSMSRTSPLLAIIFIAPMILILWFTMLIFWPLFVIPDSSFVKNPEKYDAIRDFENAVRIKYIFKRDSN